MGLLNLIEAFKKKKNEQKGEKPESSTPSFREFDNQVEKHRTKVGLGRIGLSPTKIRNIMD